MRLVQALHIVRCQMQYQQNINTVQCVPDYYKRKGFQTVKRHAFEKKKTGRAKKRLSDTLHRSGSEKSAAGATVAKQENVEK